MMSDEWGMMKSRGAVDGGWRLGPIGRLAFAGAERIVWELLAQRRGER
jgi:hypothetical protein